MPKKKNEKKKTLEEALASIEKKYGKGTIIKLDKDYDTSIPTIPTGSLILDIALGIGGVPKGRVVELLGAESAGKTTLALSIVKQAQKQGDKCVYIDAEHAFDYEYAKKMGINLNDLIISQPDFGEQGLDIVQTFIETKKIGLIVIDSVASLTPKAEIDGEMADNQIGLQARLMSKALRKLVGVISKTNTCVIFVNQIRMKIGVMFGSNETSPGGRALKFYSSVRIDLRRLGTLKQGEQFVGTEVRAKIVKNKVAPPFKIAKFKIYFDEGLSSSADILELATSHGIIVKKGAWFSYNGQNIGQGEENTRQYLKSNPEVLEEIKVKVLELLGKK